MPCNLSQDPEAGKAGNERVGSDIGSAGDPLDICDRGHGPPDHAVQDQEALPDGIAQARGNTLAVLVAECGGTSELDDTLFCRLGNCPEKEFDPSLPGPGPLRGAQAFPVVGQANAQDPRQGNGDGEMVVQEREPNQSAGGGPKRCVQPGPSHREASQHDLRQARVPGHLLKRVDDELLGRSGLGTAVAEDPDSSRNRVSGVGIACLRLERGLHCVQASRRGIAPWTQGRLVLTGKQIGKRDLTTIQPTAVDGLLPELHRHEGLSVRRHPRRPGETEERSLCLTDGSEELPVQIQGSGNRRVACHSAPLSPAAASRHAWPRCAAVGGLVSGIPSTRHTFILQIMAKL